MNESDNLIDIRVRNNLIGYFDSVLDFHENDDGYDLNSILNEWEDWVGCIHPLSSDSFSCSVYSKDEIDALIGVDKFWIVFCDATPKQVDAKSMETSSTEWIDLVCAVKKAIYVFNKRGRFGES